MTIVEIISSIISSIALLFSLLTFWYVSLRKGKIIIQNPISFKSIGSPSVKEKVPIQMPLVLSNTGSKSKILTQIYLTEVNSKIIFNYSSLISELSILEQDERIPPKPLIIPPFSSILVNIEFQSEEIVFAYDEKVFHFIVKSKINNSKKEVVIGEINIKVPQDKIQQLNVQLRMVENALHAKQEGEQR